MKKINALIQCLFFILLANTGIAQPVFTANQDNIQETVDEIFEIYGHQIKIDDSEVYAFVKELVIGSNPDRCNAPFPQIQEVNEENISFHWEAVPDVKDFSGANLDLYNGEVRPFSGSGTEINFTDLEGLMLFGFKSDCENNVKSGASIIIADVDLLFPVPTQGQNCNCPGMVSMPLYTGPTFIDQFFPVAWPGNCTDTKYRIRLYGHYGFESGDGKPQKPSNTGDGPDPNAYYSEISFVHVQSTLPNMVFLLNQCDINAETSAVPFFAGDPGIYSTSFTNGSLIVHLLAQPGANFYVDELILDVCACDGLIGDDGSERSLGVGKVLTDQVSLFPNPVENEFQLLVETASQAPVSIIVVDNLGNQITAPIEVTPSVDGQVQLIMPTTSWVPGVYHLNISGKEINRTVRFSKI